MTTKKIDKIDLNDQLRRLSEIAEWFEQQEEVDVEEGLKKVKEAALLIKMSKKRLTEVENEFEEIKKDIADEVEEVEENEDNNVSEEIDVQNEEVDIEDEQIENIPF
ncbi:MAG: exodeoxyribonuclease VII small subunit [Patescibacteria group bacterium]|nr:exodeoxyribonuclease VII small subunit [Patescibacteria group bacterium]